MIAERHLEGLRGHDPSLAVVLAAFVRSASGDGTVRFRGLVLALQALYEEDGNTWEGGWIAGLTGGPMAENLANSALPRLASLGWITDAAATGWDPIRAGAWWEGAARDRTASEVALLALARDEWRRATRGTPSRADNVGPRVTLEAKGLRKSFRRRAVVNDVSVRVEQGEIVGLLGPNGAGKTTTFYCITGLIRPDAGTIHLGDRDVTGEPMYKRARAGLGYLAQEPSIFRKLSVEDNILAILETRPLGRKERRERLEQLLDELSIKHLRKNMAYSLSGGERRRLEITRALATEPKFMLLDEPFAGVDPIAVHDIQTIVAGLRHRNIGVLITDHNVEQTLDIVDRAYIMYEGRVQASGTVHELVYDDEVAELYLGPILTARLRARMEMEQPA